MEKDYRSRSSTKTIELKFYKENHQKEKKITLVGTKPWFGNAEDVPTRPRNTLNINVGVKGEGEEEGRHGSHLYCLKTLLDTCCGRGVSVFPSEVVDLSSAMPRPQQPKKCNPMNTPHGLDIPKNVQNVDSRPYSL